MFLYAVADFFFFFKQKTAYEIKECDWSSDVCSSDLMERIEQGQPFTVLVDYAHTPGAFEKLMGIARPLTDGQLIAVFGSAGERDREKRPIQGAMAARFCDLLVLTDEDP